MGATPFYRLNRGRNMADETQTEEIDGGEAIVSLQNRVTIKPVSMALLKLRKGDRYGRSYVVRT